MQPHDYYFPSCNSRWVDVSIPDLRPGDRVKIHQSNGDLHHVIVATTYVGVLRENGIYTNTHHYTNDTISRIELDTVYRPKLPTDPLSQIKNVRAKNDYRLFPLGIRRQDTWLLFTENGTSTPFSPDEIVSWVTCD